MASDARYPHVFQPIKLGPVEVANRVYMAPHGIPLEAPLASDQVYKVPSQEAAFYYGERAAGGTGLVFHSTIVSPAGRQPNLVTTPWFDEAVPSYAKVADEVHRHGGKIMAELWYAEFMEKLWEPMGPQLPILGPSAIQQWYMPSVMRSMTKDDIRRAVADHGVSARNLGRAGYDGIEIHASHSAMSEYFMSPSFNRRTDEYGGSLENRMRFLLEVLETTREHVEHHMAVGIRLTVDELVENGYHISDCREIIEALVPTGLVDFIDLDVSIEPEQTNLMVTSFFFEKHHNAHRVAEVRDAAGSLPILATPGRVTDVADIEELLANNVADMIGAVRGLIAEPDMLKNAREGRESQSRKCIAANHCLDAGMLAGFGCAINPEAGKEVRWRRETRKKAPTARNVVVVGGGPAGLEAARVATHRGHSVTLFESQAHLGGNLHVWSKLTGRENLSSLIDWYERILPEQGVKIHLETAADVNTILGEHPDAVIIATGARYAENGDNGYKRAPIPGADQDFVFTPEQVIEQGVDLSGRVFVLDEEGLHAGAGLAELAAAAGGQVQIASRKAGPGAHLITVQGDVVERLLKAGVMILPGMWLKSIGDHTVTLTPAAPIDDIELPADTVILATMRRPVNELETQLDGKVPVAYIVGDAFAPRTLREATYEGYRFARTIGEPDMPKNTSEAMYTLATPLRPAATIGS